MNKIDYSKYQCPYAHLEKEGGHELHSPEGYQDANSVWCRCGYRSPVFYLDPEQLGLKLIVTDNPSDKKSAEEILDNYPDLQELFTDGSELLGGEQIRIQVVDAINEALATQKENDKALLSDVEIPKVAIDALQAIADKYDILIDVKNKEPKEQKGWSDDKLRKLFKLGESWGVTYSTWFTPTEKDHDEKFQEAIQSLQDKGTNTNQ